MYWPVKLLILLNLIGRGAWTEERLGKLNNRYSAWGVKLGAQKYLPTLKLTTQLDSSTSIFLDFIEWVHWHLDPFFRNYNHVQSKVDTGRPCKQIIQPRLPLRREESTAGLAAKAAHVKVRNNLSRNCWNKMFDFILNLFTRPVRYTTRE